MRQNPYYTIAYLRNKAYLLPFGEMSALRRSSLLLNDAGAQIWSALEQADAPEALLALCAPAFSGADRESALADIRSFLGQLSSLGVLLDDASALRYESRFALRADMKKGFPTPRQYADSLPHPVTQLEIAGIRLLLHAPKEAVSDDFDLFLAPVQTPSADAVDYLDTLELYCSTALPPVPESCCIMRTSALAVCETADSYILTIPDDVHIREIHLEKSGNRAVFFCCPPYDGTLRQELFLSIRTVFCYLAAKHGMYAVHSASVLYQKKAWLFAAPSGTGKSTHTRLWNEVLQTPVLNGDLNLVALRPDSPVVLGIPWCGTSGIRTCGCHPLGGITLLKQEAANNLHDLTAHRQAAFVLQRVISPLWTREQLANLVSFVNTLTEQVPVLSFGCTVSEDAVHVMRGAVDGLLTR